MIFYVNLLMCIKFLAVIYKNIAFQNMGAQAVRGSEAPPWNNPGYAPGGAPNSDRVLGAVRGVRRGGIRGLEAPLEFLRT